MLKINSSFGTGKQTITEVSFMLFRIMKGLANVDSFFSSPVLRKENFDDVEIDLSSEENKIVSHIADTILNFFKKDILKNEKVEVSSTDYSRDFGFRPLIQYRIKNSEISFTCNLGSNSVNSLGQLSNNGFVLSKELGENIIRQLVSDPALKVQRGALKLSEINFLRASKPYKYSLGLLTYFSDESEWQIPDDLEGIEYEHTDEGKYLILSREDITSDPEKLESGKQKLLSTMEEIKRRVPEYGK